MQLWMQDEEDTTAEPTEERGCQERVEGGVEIEMVSEEEGTESISVLAPMDEPLEQPTWAQPVQALAKASAAQGTPRTSPVSSEQVQVPDAVLPGFRPWLQS